MQRTVAFATLLTWCALLLAGRILYTGTLVYVFLVWNLMLATVPAFAAARFATANSLGRPAVVQAAWATLWLLFLPNAPYIATDFVHLHARPPAPLWYDLALLLSCAITGLLLAFSSIDDVQRVVTRRFGPVTSWLCAAGALVLSGFGIYLGRFLRWNSWDVATNPVRVFGDVARPLADPFGNPRSLGVTAVYGCSLVIGYIAFSLLAPHAASSASKIRNQKSEIR